MVLILLFFDAYESQLHATDSKQYAPHIPNSYAVRAHPC